MNKRDVLISVCIPVYNVKEYLNRCIDSIINQTHKNLEILIIDDGSCDGSSTICDNYEKLDQRVKVIHQENKGLPYTRQLLWSISHGEYISYIDSDDYIEPSMYEKLLDFGYGNDIIQYGFMPSGAHYDRWKDYESKRIFDEKIILNKADYLELYFKREIMPALWQRLFKRELSSTSQIRCYYSSMEDHFNFPFMVWNANHICITNCKYYHWETRVGSLGHPNSSEFDQKSAEARFMSGLSICDFISNYGDELSIDLLQYASWYLESYLCQTAMHITKSPNMSLDWIEINYKILKKNISYFSSALEIIPMSVYTQEIFELLNREDYDTLHTYMTKQYLPNMKGFLNKFKFNG